jgi:hypothetical protein
MSGCNAAKTCQNLFNNEGIFIMIFASLIAHVKDRLTKRAEFRRLVAEINSLTQSDLTDLNADRGDMIHGAYQQVYG